MAELGVKRIIATGAVGSLSAEFFEHYHKRSNVETTFMAIKTKFGDTLKSKNEVAQVNEL